MRSGVWDPAGTFQAPGGEGLHALGSGEKHSVALLKVFSFF